jgi:hypothetical protein
MSTPPRMAGAAAAHAAILQRPPVLPTVARLLALLLLSMALITPLIPVRPAPAAAAGVRVAATPGATTPAGAPALAQESPEQVTVGLYINNIQHLDLHAYTYAVDFYIWLRWRDRDLDPSKTLEFMNARQPWGDAATLLYDEPVPMPDGSLYQAIRYQGVFANKFPLQRYPFDRQNLLITFEDSTYPQDLLVYVPDDPAVTIGPEIDLPGYDLHAPSFQVVQHDYPTTFGDLTLDAPAPYSRGIANLEITRPPVAATIKVLLPILLMVIVAALTLFIDPSFPVARVGMGITALLALISKQISTNDALPQTDYLIMLDVLYICAYAFVLVMMAGAVYTTWMVTSKEIERAVAFDRKSFALCTSGYLISVIATVFIFLR